jgi:Tfp pilus assembly protein PilO
MYANTNNRLWIVGSALLVVAIIAMGWFLGVSPKLSEAGTADQQRVTAEAQNVVHEKEVATIKKQYEQLPELKGQLSVLREALPTNDDLSTFLGELHQMEQSNGVVLTSFVASDAKPYAPVVKPVTDVSTTNPLVKPENFVAIPVELDVVGDEANVMDFIEGVQTGERLFLVTDLALEQDETKTAYSAKIKGFVYVLLDKPATPAKTGAAATTPANAPKG